MYKLIQEKLTKNISGLSKPDGFWKVKNPVRIVERLSLLINIMEDLLKPANKHHSESKLYNGDTRKQIYILLDNIRIMQ